MISTVTIEDTDRNRLTVADFGWSLEASGYKTRYGKLPGGKWGLEAHDGKDNLIRVIMEKKS